MNETAAQPATDEKAEKERIAAEQRLTEVNAIKVESFDLLAGIQQAQARLAQLQQRLAELTQA